MSLNPFEQKKKETPVVTNVEAPVATMVAEAPKPQEEKETKPTIILSEIDGYIHERLKEQPKTLSDVKFHRPDYEKVNDLLRLPKELESFRKEYAFKWIYKKKMSIDRHLDTLGYVLVTKLYFPTLAKRLFSSQGCIERGDAILGFVPLKRAEFLRSEPGRLSMERIKNLPIEKWKDGGEKYYKPSLTEEKDGQEVVAGIQPDSKDFQES